MRGQDVTGLHGRRPLAWALAVLLATGIALSGAEMVSSANEVNRIRGDFCDWSAVHYRVLAAEPPSAARAADASSDARLMRELGCGGKP